MLIGSEAVRMGLLLLEGIEGQSWSKVELFMLELLILVISRDSCVESPVEDNYVISECEGDSLREKVLYLFNLRLRSRMVVINQIRNVYMPNLVRNGSESRIE
jgi:hypothetical protein